MMSEHFNLDPSRVHPEARLVDDLELDSLDALDLTVKVEETTGRALAEKEIRLLRTIDDVIVALQRLLGSDGRSGAPRGLVPSES